MHNRIPGHDELLNVSAALGTNSEAPDLWNGLVGWWPMQEGGGGTAFDVSGRGNDLTITGLGSTVNWSTGKYGYALDFTGSTGLARSLLNTSLGRPLTLMWIVESDDWTWRDCGGLTDADTTAANVHNVTLWFDGTADQGNIYSENNAGNDTLPLANSGGYHVILWTVTADDPGDTYLWVNGANVGSDTLWGRGPTSCDRVRLGDAEIYNSNGFDGRIAWFQIWDHVLLDSHISRLYADPWAMGRLRPRVFAVSGAAAPTWDTIHQLSPGAPANDVWRVAP